MKVATANVLLSFNKDFLLEILNSNGNISGSIKKSNGVFLFDNNTNSNLISFSHSYGLADSLGAPQDAYFSISLIDPNGIFEETFLSYLFDLKKNKEEVENKFLIKQTALIGPTNINLVDEFTKITGNDTAFTVPIYVAYGIGSNSEDWAGPYMFRITGLKYRFEENGVRVLELLGSPQLDTLLANTDATGNEISFDFLDDLFHSKWSEPMEPDDLFATQAGVPSILQTIIKVLSGFIQQNIKDKQVLVVFPDLEADIRALYNGFVERFSTKYSRDLVFDLPKNYINMTPEQKEALVFQGRAKQLGISRLANKALYEALGFNVTVSFKPIEKLPSVSYLENETKLMQDTDTILDYSSSRKYYVSLFSVGYNGASKTLKKLMDRIKNYLPNFYPSIFWETDVKVLRRLKKYNIIESEDKELLIIGDHKTIIDYIYGHSVLNNNLDSKLRKFQNIVVPQFFTRNLNITSEYLQEAAEDVYKHISPFGPLSVFSKDFSDDLLAALTPAQAKEAVELNNPIFVYGLKNSNILSIDYDIDSVYGNVLNSNYIKSSPEATVSVYGSTYLNLIKDNELVKFILDSPTILQRDFNYFNDQLESYYEERKQVDNSKVSKMISFILGKDLKEVDNINVSNPTEYRKLLYKVFSLLFINKENLTGYYMDETRGIDPVSHRLKLIEKTYNLQTVLDIKTLPYFSLSRQSLISRHCLVVITEPDIIGIKTKNRRSFMSGVYLIVGFLHTISQDDISSKFKLVRVFNSIVTP